MLKRGVRIIISLVFITLLLTESLSRIHASPLCADANIQVQVEPDPIYSRVTPNMKLTVSGRQPTYKVLINCDPVINGCVLNRYEQNVQNNIPVTITDSRAIQLFFGEFGYRSGQRIVWVYTGDGSTQLCHSFYTIKRGQVNPSCESLTITPDTNAAGTKTCFDLTTKNITVISNNVTEGGQPVDSSFFNPFVIRIDNRAFATKVNISNGSISPPAQIDISSLSLTQHKLVLENNDSIVCESGFTKLEVCNPEDDTVEDTNTTEGPPVKIKPDTCFYNNDSTQPGVKTALGCIPYEPIPLIGWVLRWGIGLGGGIAFLLMAFASFQLMTSAGDPEKLKNGKEMFVSAGAGLVFIIFSVFLLQLIGTDILQIPGFSR